jgi:ABC-type spermidine/putrescine transport system permease subunit II
LVLAAALVFLYAPIIMVVVNSVNGDVNLVSWGGFTGHWYQQAFSDPQVRGPFQTSVIIAVVGTAISLALAVSAGLWWRSATRRLRLVLNGVTAMRIVLPEVVIAVGMFLFFKRAGLPLGMFAVIAGHVVFLSAYATVIVQARLSSMDVTLEEAASDLGARPWRVFRRVTLPLLMPAILAAALLCLVFSFDDVITTLFLGGTSVNTLPLLLFGLIRFNVTPEVNAIGSGVMLVTSITFVCAILVSRLGSFRIVSVLGGSRGGEAGLG